MQARKKIQKKNQLCPNLNLWHLYSRTVRKYISVKSPNLWYFVIAALPHEYIWFFIFWPITFQVLLLSLSFLPTMFHFQVWIFSSCHLLSFCIFVDSLLNYSFSHHHFVYSTGLCLNHILFRKLFSFLNNFRSFLHFLQ